MTRKLTSTEAQSIDDIVRPILLDPERFKGPIQKQRDAVNRILDITRSVMMPGEEATDSTTERVAEEAQTILRDTERAKMIIDGAVYDGISSAMSRIFQILTSEPPANGYTNGHANGKHNGVVNASANGKPAVAPAAGSVSEAPAKQKPATVEADRRPKSPALHTPAEPKPESKEASPRIKTLLPTTLPAQDRRISKNAPVEKVIAGHVLTPSETLLARECGLEVAGDEKMERAWKKLLTFAPTPMVMLIRGESGTGKEPFAQAVDKLRKKQSLSEKDHGMVIINCAALNEGIIESELFGHVKGAYTGALENRTGKFKEADGGTLFLDEIGDMPLPQQAKLLRVLEEGMITPAGSNKAEKIDVKVVCATNRNLEEMVEKKLFRKDLFERLKACQLQLPSWHERTEAHRRDLLEYIRDVLTRKYPTLPPLELQESAVLQLLSTDFSGNVREAKYLLERAYISAASEAADAAQAALGKKEILEATDRPIAVKELSHKYGSWEHGEFVEKDGKHAIDLRLTLPLTDQLPEVKSQLMHLLAVQAFTHVCGRHVGRTAKYLGLSRRSVTDYLRFYIQNIAKGNDHGLPTMEELDAEATKSDDADETKAETGK